MILSSKMYGGNNGGGAPPQWPSRKPAAKKAPALRITNISSGATELRMPAAPPKKPAAKKPAAKKKVAKKAVSKKTGSKKIAARK